MSAPRTDDHRCILSPPAMPHAAEENAARGLSWQSWNDRALRRDYLDRYVRAMEESEEREESEGSED